MRQLSSPVRARSDLKDVRVELVLREAPIGARLEGAGLAGWHREPKLVPSLVVCRDGDLYVEGAARHGGRPDWALPELSRVEAGRNVQ